MTDGLAWK